MNGPVSVIVFDVNETLSDMSPLETRFTDVGAPGSLARLWFASLLRDGFAVAATGGSVKFSVVAAEMLEGLLRELALNRALDDAVTHVLGGLGVLNLHADVEGGVRALKQAGHRLATLSNGSDDLAEGLLTRASIRSDFEAVLSVEDAPAWKPVRSAYEYAADALGVRPENMLLVAVHSWDIHGAAEAGLRTAWLNRSDARYPSYFAAPDHTIRALSDLVAHLPGR